MSAIRFTNCKAPGLYTTYDEHYSAKWVGLGRLAPVGPGALWRVVDRNGGLVGEFESLSACDDAVRAAEASERIDFAEHIDDTVADAYAHQQAKASEQAKARRERGA